MCHVQEDAGKVHVAALHLLAIGDRQEAAAVYRCAVLCSASSTAESLHCGSFYHAAESCRPALNSYVFVPNRRAGLQVEAEAAGGDTHIASGRV